MGTAGLETRSLVTPRHRLGAAPLRARLLAALAPAALLLAAGLHTSLVGRLQRHPLLVGELDRMFGLEQAPRPVSCLPPTSTTAAGQPRGGAGGEGGHFAGWRRL
jgi:hypothetical protein